MYLIVMPHPWVVKGVFGLSTNISHSSRGISHRLLASLSGPEVSYREPHQLQAVALHDENVRHLDVHV